MIRAHKESMSTERAAVGLLIHAKEQPASLPSERASTRLVAAWGASQHPVVYCDIDGVQRRGTGLVATGWQPCLTTDTWRPVEDQPLRAIYNRYPLQRAPEALRGLADDAVAMGIPFGNHPALQTLVRDKWQVQQIFVERGLPMPAATLATATWPNALKAWKRAYLKPRYGAFGEGIYLLTWDAEATTVEGPLPHQRRTFPSTEGARLADLLDHCDVTDAAQDGPSHFLQQAIAPPMSSLRGFSIRSLVQQDADGSWINRVRVARCAEDDPVANVARKAKAISLEALCDAGSSPALSRTLLLQLAQLDEEIARTLQEQLTPLPRDAVLELGIDYVVDPTGQSWLLEINGFPQGRLGALAAQDPQRYGDAHRRVVTQPLVTLTAAPNEDEARRQNDVTSI